MTDATQKQLNTEFELSAARDRLAKIHAASEDVTTAEREWVNAREVASECKKVYEAAVLNLRDVIRPIEPTLPLFD